MEQNPMIQKYCYAYEQNTTYSFTQYYLLKLPLCMCTCVCRCLCAFIVEARIWHWMSSSLACLLVLWDRISPWIWSSPCLIPVSYSIPSMPSIFTLVQGSASDPHACNNKQFTAWAIPPTPICKNSQKYWCGNALYITIQSISHQSLLLRNAHASWK